MRFNISTFFLPFCTFFLFSNSAIACDLSSLTIDHIQDIGSNQYEITLTFCAGAGRNTNRNGADQNTANFAFFLHGGATIISHPVSLTSPNTQNVFYAYSLFADTVLYFEDSYPTWDGYADSWWACIDGGCGPVQAACETFTMVTDGLPEAIELLGMEGAGNPAAGCPMTVYPACFSSNLSVDATASADKVYVGYAAAACSQLSATASNGSGNYAYLWSTGATTPSINVCPTQSTSYDVTVTDLQTNCTSSASVLVEAEDVRCGNKIRVCYRGRERCVSLRRVNRFLNRGGNLGYCTYNTRMTSESELALSAFETIIYQDQEILEIGILSDIETNISLRMISIDGRPVIAPISRSINPDHEEVIEIPKTNLSTGLYFIQIVSEGQRPMTKKVFISY